MSRVAKLIKFPEELVREIEEYKINHYVTSFTGAVLELVRLGLETKNK